MNEELRPCPFCGEMPMGEDDRYMCSTLGCVMQEDTISAKEWNTRPIEDVLQSRIAELENEHAVWLVGATNEIDRLNARIAELEAENDRLQSGWFRDETICPDGSLRANVSDLLNRIAKLEAHVAELEAETEVQG